MTTKSKKSIFDDYSLEEVPGVERYGLYNLFLTLSAAFGAIAVLFAGGCSRRRLIVCRSYYSSNGG